MLPAQKESATQQSSAVVSLANDKIIRGAKTALSFAILAAILLVSTFLMGVPLSNLHLDYRLLNSFTLVGFSLAGICGLSAIVIGTRSLRAARWDQAIPMRAIHLARTAVFLGSIAGGIAIFYIIVLVAVMNGLYIRA